MGRSLPDPYGNYSDPYAPKIPGKQEPPTQQSTNDIFATQQDRMRSYMGRYYNIQRVKIRIFKLI